VSTFAGTLETFFTQRLAAQRQASPHTVTAYRDTFRLLLHFTQRRTGKPPSTLAWTDLDATLIAAFLQHLETDRGNSPRTRNARLAAIHSLFRFAALRHPEHAALINRVLAIPTKRYERAIVSFLTRREIQALLSCPDQATWIGRRDHALLLLVVQTGLRVSELTRLRRQDLHLDTGAHIRTVGKGRKERVTPLTAQRRCPSLRGKKVSPHVLRHTAAMQLLQAGVDISVIALWLGHEGTRTTQIYLHADLTIKQRALARTAPPHTAAGRYRPPDPLLAFLESL